jgi:acyl-CoA synthetase (AMP-forming)/AMP-acid ligase II
MTSLSGPANIRTEGKLFISAIEDKARWIPNHTFMRYPPKDWETKGYQSISYGQWSNAIDKVAFWLDSQLGKVGDSGTVAYFGPNDARYAIITPAVIKSGRRVSCR